MKKVTLNYAAFYHGCVLGHTAVNGVLKVGNLLLIGHKPDELQKHEILDNATLNRFNSGERSLTAQLQAGLLETPFEDIRSRFECLQYQNPSEPARRAVRLAEYTGNATGRLREFIRRGTAADILAEVFLMAVRCPPRKGCKLTADDLALLENICSGSADNGPDISYAASAAEQEEPVPLPVPPADAGAAGRYYYEGLRLETCDQPIDPKRDGPLLIKELSILDEDAVGLDDTDFYYMLNRGGCDEYRLITLKGPSDILLRYLKTLSYLPFTNAAIICIKGSDSLSLEIIDEYLSTLRSRCWENSDINYGVQIDRQLAENVYEIRLLLGYSADYYRSL